jgi:hypothetical protein
MSVVIGSNALEYNGVKVDRNILDTDIMMTQTEYDVFIGRHTQS